MFGRLKIMKQIEVDGGNSSINFITLYNSRFGKYWRDETYERANTTMATMAPVEKSEKFAITVSLKGITSVPRKDLSNCGTRVITK